MKTVLHQILALDKDATRAAQLIQAETQNTFTKKDDHFDGLTKIYTALEEGGIELPAETKEIVTTVPDKLSYTAESFIRALDLTLTKEETNSSGNAKAELAIDVATGSISFGTLSATSLLALEARLEALRTNVYSNVPTLNPLRTWTLKQDAKNVYATASTLKYRLEKKNKPIVSVQATDKHPAQVHIVTEDINVGKYETTELSGKLPVLAKSQLLERLDTLIAAVKSARAQANMAETTDIAIGKKIIDYLHEGIV